MASAGTVTVDAVAAVLCYRKRCRKCLEYRPEGYFGKHTGLKNRNNTSRKSICKSCEHAEFVIRRAKLAAELLCIVAGCDGGAATRKHGLCDAHMARLRKGAPVDGPIRRFRVKKGRGYIDRNGYKRIRVSRSDGRKSIAEHRIVLERYLGRELIEHENVHHKNGDRSDNRIENLELWSTIQPQGKRPADLVNYAREILSLYEKDHG